MSLSATGGDSLADHPAARAGPATAPATRAASTTGWGWGRSTRGPAADPLEARVAWLPARRLGPPLLFAARARHFSRSSFFFPRVGSFFSEGFFPSHFLSLSISLSLSLSNARVVCPAPAVAIPNLTCALAVTVQGVITVQRATRRPSPRTPPLSFCCPNSSVAACFPLLEAKELKVAQIRIRQLRHPLPQRQLPLGTFRASCARKRDT
jgi:hypothetical protein